MSVGKSKCIQNDGSITHMKILSYELADTETFVISNKNYRFSTSRQTLSCIPDTFFTALLSGRISSLRDDSGAIFIDRDPTLFGIILNYLRTRDIDIKQCDLRILRHEAEYYNISPLIRRLVLCEDLNHSSCGDVWFYAHLTPPSMYATDSVFISIKSSSDKALLYVVVVPGQELNDAPAGVGTSIPQGVSTATSSCAQATAVNPNAGADTNASQGSSVAPSVSCSNNHEISAPVSAAPIPLAAGSLINARPGSMVRVPETIANGSEC